MKRRTALAVAAAAALLAIGWSSLTVRANYGGHWSALFCIGSNFQRPPEMDREIRVFPGSSGYDGQFYRLIAHDPFFQRGYDHYIDASRLRYRRILIPWLAWLLALGRDEWIDGAYIACIWAFLFLGAFWTARFAGECGRSAWWGLAYLLLPSTLISLDRMLVDLPLVTLGLGFLYFLRLRKSRPAWVCAALAGLCRETGILFPMAYAAYLLWRRKPKEAALYTAAIIPFAVWTLVVQFSTSGAGYTGHLARPFAGILAAFPDRTPYALSGFLLSLVRSMDYAALCGMLVCWVLVCLVREPSWRWIGAAFVCLGFYMSCHIGNRDFTHVFAYSRQYGPVLLLLLLDAFATGRWLRVLPAAPIVLRTAMEFYRQVHGLFS